MKDGKNGSRLNDIWHEALFLGVQDRSDEVVVGTRDGAFKARRVRRLDPVQRRDAALAREMRGLPWDPVPGVPNDDGEVPILIVRVAAAPVATSGELPPVVVPVVPAERGLYVRKADITAYGPSPNCQGCVELVLDTKRAFAHSPECREDRCPHAWERQRCGGAPRGGSQAPSCGDLGHGCGTDDARPDCGIKFCSGCKFRRRA